VGRARLHRFDDKTKWRHSIFLLLAKSDGIKHKQVDQGHDYELLIAPVIAPREGRFVVLGDVD